MRISGLSYQLITKNHSRGNLLKELRKILKSSNRSRKRKVNTKRRRRTSRRRRRRTSRSS